MTSVSKMIVQYKNDMLFEAQLGQHTIQIDVPSTMNGKNRGPTPPEFFFLSLASCIAAFVANYCENAKLDATDMKVELEYEKLSKGCFGNLNAKIILPHANFEGREQAILRVAEHCPVHSTICEFEGLNITLEPNGK